MGLLARLQSRFEVRRMERKYTSRRKADGHYRRTSLSSVFSYSPSLYTSAESPHLRQAEEEEEENEDQEQSPSMATMGLQDVPEEAEHFVSATSTIAAPRQPQALPPRSNEAKLELEAASLSQDAKYILPEIHTVSVSVPDLAPSPSPSSIGDLHLDHRHSRRLSTLLLFRPTSQPTSLTHPHSRPCSLSRAPSRSRSTAGVDWESTPDPFEPRLNQHRLSRNSRGQSWEPPLPGWGSDGTEAFKHDKKDFRFDVDGDRRSAGGSGGFTNPLDMAVAGV